MKIVKIILLFCFIFLSLNLYSFDSLVQNEKYFNNAIKISKQNNFGQNRIVAILDTGININNELKGKIIAEYDFTKNSSKVYDKSGHGTKIASIISSANDGIGITGIAYNAKLIDAKVVDDNGNIKTKNIIRAIEFAVKHGANVINMSFSSPEYSQNLQNIINKYAQKGVIFVASAGNNGSSEITYPAGYNNVVAVGSLDRKTGKRAIYSNYGKWVDEWVEDGIWTYDGKKYSREYGTSETCAVVASILINQHKKQKIIIENKKGNYKLCRYATKENQINNFNNTDYSFFNSIYYYLYAQTNLKYAFKIQRILKFQKLSYIYNKPTGKPLTSCLNITLEAWNQINNSFKNILKIATTDKTDKDDILINLYKAMFFNYIELKYGENKLLNNNTNYEKLIKFLKDEKKKLDDFDNNNKFINGNEDFKKTLIVAQDTIDFLNKNGYDIDPILSMFISKIKDIYLDRNNMTNYNFINNITQFEYDKKLKKMLNIFSKIIDILDKKNQSDRMIAFLQIEREQFDSILSEYIAENNYFIKYINSTNFKEKIKVDLTNEFVNLAFTESFQYIFKNMSEIMLKRLKSNIITRIFLGNLEKLTTDQKSILANKFGYDFLQNIINDLDMLQLSYDFKDIGYLTSKDLESFATLSALVKTYNYYSAKFLISMMAYKPFKDLIDGISEEDINTAKIIKITTDTYSINNKYYKSYYFNLNPNLNTLKKITLGNFNTFIDNNFVKDTPMQNTIDLIDTTGTLVIKVGQKLSDVIFELATGNKADPYTTGQALKEYLDNINNFKIGNMKNINKVQKFAQMYAEIQSAYSLWLKAAIDLHKSSSLLNLVAKQNIKRDNEISFYDSIYNLYKNSQSNLDDNIIQNDFIDKIVYSASGYILHNTKATRTFFYEQILKGLGLNPWVDRIFFKNLKENKIQIPIDLDFKPSNFNDNIYILYARYKKYTTVNNLDGNPVFYPTNNIYRGTAILAMMKIIEKEYKESEIYKNANNYVEEELSKFKEQNPDLCFSNTLCDSKEVKSAVLEFLKQYKTRDGIILKDRFSDDYEEIADYSVDMSDVVRILTAIEITKDPNPSLLKKEEHLINGESPKIMLKENLTQYQAILLKNRLLNFFKNNNDFYKSIFNNDKIGEFADTGYQVIELGYGPGSIITIEGTNSLPKIYINKKNKLKLKTKIPYNNKDRYLINWSIDKKYGRFISFNKINLNGYVVNEIELEPKNDMVDKIIKLHVNVIDTVEKKKSSKNFYVRVVDNETYINNLNVSSTQFRIQYLSNNQFKINWNIKNAKAVKFEYSFDNKKWEDFDFINLMASNKTESNKIIKEAKNHNKIYIRANVLDKNSNHIYKTKELYYTPEKEYVEKSTEIPAKTTIWGRQNGNTNSVKICWKKIIDSHYKLNIDNYELKYAKSNTSDEITLKFNDNSDPNNIYSSNCRIIDGLNEDTTYYFQVRGCNDLGCGDWSDTEFVTIDIDYKPEFDVSYQYPNDGAMNVDKKPIFKWKVNNPDNKSLEYYVRWGENKNDLRYRGDWSGPDQSFDYKDSRYNKDLKPNTKYYWQVVMRESHHFMDKYTKSPIWSFTTTSQGADIAIVDAKLLSKLEPGKKVSFELSIANLGTEPTKPVFIQAYYKKGDTITPFADGSVKFNDTLNRNGFKKVKIDVQFKTYTFTNDSGIKFDNVLVPGKSYVIFDMPYVKYDNFDTNLSNDKYLIEVNYDDKNRPKFDNITIKNNSISSIMNETDDFYAILNKNLQISYEISDDIEVKKIELLYRISENDEWKNIATIENKNENSKDRMNNFYDWKLPNDLKLITNNMQIKIKAYDTDSLYSEYITRPFKVVRELSLSDIKLDKESYIVGDKAYLSFKLADGLPIKYIKVVYRTPSHATTVYEQYKSTGLNLYNLISFNLPNDNIYASDQAYLTIELKDSINQYKKVLTNNFSVKANNTLPKIFYKWIDVYENLNKDIPSDATASSSYNKIEAIKYDNNDNIHIVVSSDASYVQNGKSYLNKKYYYLYYDTKANKLSQAVQIVNDLSESGKSLVLKDMILYDSKPILIFYKENNFYMTYKTDNSFIDLENILNNQYVKWNEVAFFNFNDSIYIKWVDTYLGTTSNERRNAYKKVYPSIEDKHLFSDQYLGHYIKINNQKLYNSCNIFELNSDLKIVKKIYSIDIDQCSLLENFSYYNNFNSIIGIDNRSGKFYIVGDMENKKFEFKIKNSFYDVGSIYTNELILFDMGNNDLYKYYIDKNITENLHLSNKFSYINNHLLFDISQNKQMVFGNIRNGDKATIVLTDLSKNIVPPVVKFENDSNIALYNAETIHLKWKTKGLNTIKKFLLYEAINNNTKLIKQIDKNKYYYDYKIPQNYYGAIKIKITAVDSNENTGSDELLLNIYKPIIFSSFDADKYDINLGDNIVFKWTSDGDKNTVYAVYARNVNTNEEDWRLLFKTTGLTSKEYSVKDFVGEYEIKIVANGQEMKLPKHIVINGYLFNFANRSFVPQGNYAVDYRSKNIMLKWYDNSKEMQYYDIWIKRSTDNAFRKVYTTSDKFYNYTIDGNQSFEWKISTRYKNKIYESDAIFVRPYYLEKPRLNEISIDTNSGVSVRIGFTQVDNAYSYGIYKTKCGNDDFVMIANIRNNIMNDYDIQYGKCYSYKIVAFAQNGNASKDSNMKNINILNSEMYNVVIENKNNAILVDNNITLKFHPDRNVKYEMYKILIGKQPNNLYLYSITNSRSINIDNLDYSTTYYVEIFPVDFNYEKINLIPAKLTFTTGFDKRTISESLKLEADEVGKNYVKLSWNTVSNADYYEIYRKNKNDNNFELIYTTLENGFDDTINIEEGKTYLYKIQAVNKNSYKISNLLAVNTPKTCTQVITHAYNPQTGEERDFSTPCDVPDGWVVGKAPDSDGDGINDMLEERYGLNPNDPSDANKDYNGNGISNKDEILSGRNPHKVDNDMLFVKRGWNLLSLGKHVPCAIRSIMDYSNADAKMLSWIYDSGTWKAQSNSNSIYQLISEKGFETFDNVKSHQGFWIRSDKKVDVNLTDICPNADTKDLDTTKLQNGWYLLGGIDTNDTELYKKLPNSYIIWKFNNNEWEVFTKKEIKNIQIKKIKKLYPNEGFWDYIKK